MLSSLLCSNYPKANKIAPNELSPKHFRMSLVQMLLFGKFGCVSTQLKWVESPTDLGLWSKDSEQLYVRASA
jgi:hypothetical protein